MSQLRWYNKEENIRTRIFALHLLLLTWNIKIWNSQGGLSDGYKNLKSGKELPDETYKEDGIALFRVQGSGPENMQAIQVEPVSLTFIYLFLFLILVKKVNFHHLHIF